MDIKLKILFRCPKVKLLRKMISRARIDRLNGRMLPEKTIEVAENEKAYKHAMVTDYLTKKNRRYLTAEPLIKAIIRKKYRNLDLTEQNVVFEDIVFCFFAYGFQPDEYLFYDLKDKSMIDRKAYISDVERIIYYMQMNDICEGEVFLDKSKTYQLFKQYYKRDALRICSTTTFSDFDEFVKKHHCFVKKRIDQSKGDGVELIDIWNVGISIEKYFEELKATNVFQLEEIIQQSQALSSFNRSSVNTIRCIAFATRHGVRVPFTFLKTGRAGSFVDNGGKGGILIGIDENTGVLNTDGMDEYGNRFASHPDSGICFKGYQLPDWEGLLRLCKEITIKVEGIKAIGWDLAHTDQGWVIVEGNMFGQFVGPQITREQGLKKEWISIMDDMDLIVTTV